MIAARPPALLLGLLLLLGCAGGADTPPSEDPPAPWVEVVLDNQTGEPVVDATLSPFDTPAFVQDAIDSPLAPGDEVRVKVRAGTWSLRYVTASGRTDSEPALELSTPRRIRLE